MSETRAYDFRVAPGGMQALPVNGKKFLITTSSGPVNVRWARGYLEGLQAGQGQDVPEGFDLLTLTNGGSIDVYGVLLVSEEDFIDKRITGDVSVIDGEKARTLAGGRFMASPYAVSGAADYACLQLHNPSTDKNLIVTAAKFSAAVTGPLYSFAHDVVLASNLTSVSSALTGYPVGVGEVRNETMAVLPVHIYGTYFTDNVAAFSERELKLSGPIVVTPGRSLCVAAQQNNTTLTARFEWFEEDTV